MSERKERKPGSGGRRPGAGRKPSSGSVGDPSRSTTFRLPVDVLDRLRALADERGVTIVRVLTDLIRGA